MERIGLVADRQASKREGRGASFQLLSLVGSGQFGINVSVPLLLEYEDVLQRPDVGVMLSRAQVDEVLDYHCAVGRHHEIFFLWRPYLRNPKDDFVLELAVKAACQFIVTFNERDFAGCEHFGIRAITPGAFLRSIGALS